MAKRLLPGLYRLPSGSYRIQLKVPPELQPIINQKQLTHIIPETDIDRVNDIAAPILRNWRQRLATARQAGQDSKTQEVARLAEQYRAQHQGEMDDAKLAFLDDVLTWVFDQYGGMTADARREALAAGRASTALSSIPGGMSAWQQITAPATTATPFLAHIETWTKATNLSGRGLAEAEATVKEFNAAHPGCTLESLTGGTVQKWVWSLLRREPNPLLPRSVSRKLAHLQNYWNHLAAAEIVADIKPFHGRKISDCRSGAEIKQAERLEFDVADVAKLLEAAKPDASLYAAVKLAVYTGIRRESICTLTTKSVKTVEGIRVFDIAEKTESGVRLVPIHSAIAGFVDALVANPTKDGYLIHAGKADQHGMRGGEIGKRFSDLKTKLGFGELYTFHSLRHTFQIAVEETGASSKVTHAPAQPGQPQTQPQAALGHIPHAAPPTGNPAQDMGQAQAMNAGTHMPTMPNMPMQPK